MAPFLPVKNAVSVCSVPRAIVPSTSGRALERFVEERARPERPVLRLIVHVLTAAGDGARRNTTTPSLRTAARLHFWRSRGPTPLALARRRRASLGPQALILGINFIDLSGSEVFMNSNVRVRSNFGSAASMARKNRSWLARARTPAR